MKHLLKVFVICILPAGTAWAAGFMPWADVLKMADQDQDQKLSPAEIMNFSERSHFQGFQPFMADHFQKYDFNKDGFLSFEECHKGMKMDGYSDEQMVAEFNRNHGFSPWKK